MSRWSPAPPVSVECAGCGIQFLTPAYRQRRYHDRSCYDASRARAARSLSPCSIDGCRSRVIARGWCVHHYNRWRRHGDPLWVRPERPRPPCSVPGCDRPHIARGWCTMHYGRWKVHGDPMPERPPSRGVRAQATWPRPSACAITGCPRPVHGRNWCGTHYQRWRKYGDPLVSRPIAGDYSAVCELDTCENPRFMKGWCSSHYYKWKKHGIPDYEQAPYVRPPCAVVDCPRVADGGRGWCGKHYQRWVMRGDPLDAGKQCMVCEHPDAHLIDELLDERRNLSRPWPRRLWRITIARQFGLPVHNNNCSVLLNHDRPGHQQRRALRELDRLVALSRAE